MSSSKADSPTDAPHIYKKGKILKFKNLEAKKTGSIIYVFSTDKPSFPNLISQGNNINQVLARVWIKISKISSFLGLEKDESEQFSKNPSVFNKLKNLIRKGGGNDNIDNIDILNVLVSQNQELEKIKNKIYPAILTEGRMRDFEEKLEEIRQAIKTVVG